MPAPSNDILMLFALSVWAVDTDKDGVPDPAVDPAPNNSAVTGYQPRAVSEYRLDESE